MDGLTDVLLAIYVASVSQLNIDFHHFAAQSFIGPQRDEQVVKDSFA